MIRIICFRVGEIKIICNFVISSSQLFAFRTGRYWFVQAVCAKPCNLVVRMYLFTKNWAAGSVVWCIKQRKYSFPSEQWSLSWQDDCEIIRAQREWQKNLAGTCDAKHESFWFCEKDSYLVMTRLFSETVHLIDHIILNVRATICEWFVLLLSRNRDSHVGLIQKLRKACTRRNMIEQPRCVIMNGAVLLALHFNWRCFPLQNS